MLHCLKFIVISDMDLLIYIKQGEINMQTKDWIVLLVPILCDGIIIFILQKISEKKQISKTIKYGYANILRQKVDTALDAYSKLLQLTNYGESDEIILKKAIQYYIDKVMDAHYYYEQNEQIFMSFRKNIDKIIITILKINDLLHKEKLDNKGLCTSLDAIKNELSNIQELCIKLKF